MRFAERLGGQLDAMEAAYAGRDFAVLAGLAHWLKGAGGTVGFDAFTEPAKHLEDLAKAENGDQVEDAIGALRSLARRIVLPTDEAPAEEPPVLSQATAPDAGRGSPPSAAESTATGASDPSGSVHGAESEPPIVSRLPVHEPRFRSIVTRFVERLAQQLVAMETAFSRRDFDELAGLAHWLKGAGGTVGFDAFTEPAKHLEQLARARSEDQVEAAMAVLRGVARRIVVPEEDPGCDPLATATSRIRMGARGE